MQSDPAPAESPERTRTPLSRLVDYTTIFPSMFEDEYVELEGVPACYRVRRVRDVSDAFYAMALKTAQPLETLHDAFWPTSSLPGIIPPKFLYGFPIYMRQVKAFCVKHLSGSVTPEEIWKDDPGFDGYWCAMASEYLTKEVGCPVVVTIALSALDTSYVASMADTYSLKDKGRKRPTEEHCDKLAQLLYGDKSGEARVKWHLDMQFCEWR